MSVNRRVWLLGGGAIVLAGLGLATPPAREALCRGRADEAYRLAVTRLGGVCVGCNPDLNAETVEREWGRLRGETETSLMARIADDFANGQIADADGWQLARTEALIYAAAYYDQERGA